MNSPNDPAHESFGTASSELAAGLRTCRTVLSNYRSLIGGQGNVDEPQAGFREAGEADEPSAD